MPFDIQTNTEVAWYVLPFVVSAFSALIIGVLQYLRDKDGLEAINYLTKKPVLLSLIAIFFLTIVFRFLLKIVEFIF